MTGSMIEQAIRNLPEDDLGSVTEFAFQLSQQKVPGVCYELSESFMRERYLNSREAFETADTDDEDEVKITVRGEVDSAVMKAMKGVSKPGRYAVSVNVYREPFGEEEEAVSQDIGQDDE
jgi:hypothetical protein